MTTTTFLDAQRRELQARRAAYTAEAEQATASAFDLTDEGASQDMADEDGFGEGDTINVERDSTNRVRHAQTRRSFCMIGISLGTTRLTPSPMDVSTSRMSRTRRLMPLGSSDAA